MTKPAPPPDHATEALKLLLHHLVEGGLFTLISWLLVLDCGGWLRHPPRPRAR